MDVCSGMTCSLAHPLTRLLVTHAAEAANMNEGNCAQSLFGRMSMTNNSIGVEHDSLGRAPLLMSIESMRYTCRRQNLAHDSELQGARELTRRWLRIGQEPNIIPCSNSSKAGLAIALSNMAKIVVGNKAPRPVCYARPHPEI